MAAKEPQNPNVVLQIRRSILIGLFLIITAFMGVIGVFYFLVDEQTKKTTEIGSLQEQINVLNTEKGLAERKASELEDEVGRYLDLDKLAGEAEKVYGAKEKDRKEGHLWIDRDARTMLATLGLLNGLSQGSRLTIFDGQTRVGYARVETPLDVISYVQPINMSLSQLESDYYRVVFEQP